MLSAVKLFLLSSLLISKALWAYEAVKISEIKPNPVLHEMMINDKVSENYALANDGALWFVGSTKLWRWYPITGSIGSLVIKNKEVLPLKFEDITYSAQNVLLVEGGNLWAMNATSGKVNIITGVSLKCSNNRFVLGGRSLALFNSCGVFSINIQQGKMTQVLADIDYSKFEKVTAIQGTDDLLALGGKELYKLSKSEVGFKSQLIYSAKSRLKGAEWTDDGIVAWSSKALMVFDPVDFKKLKTIQNTGLRSIEYFVSFTGTHLFLFNDGVIEIMVKEGNKQFSAKLDKGDFVSLTVDPGGAFIVIKQKSFPKVLDIQKLVK